MLTIWSRGAGRAMLLLSLFLLAQTVFSKAEYRALWVDVFHDGLRSKAEADTMLQTAREAGYNTLIIEVRKACDAYYNSGMEPKNPAVQDGFDPLGYIIEQAHKEPRMEVHAWLVTYRARIGSDTTYKHPQHVYTQHPEWLSETRNGNKSSGSMYYLDPGVPQVIDYNLMVVRDLLSRYDVDGIVFDYIRYPETDGSASAWGYNPIALKRFNALYNKSGKPEVSDPEFAEFRRRQIYDHMRKIYAHVRAWRPRVKIGAATITWGGLKGDFTKTSTYASIFQDWQTMAVDGWLDVVLPMNYKREGRSDQARDHRDWAAFLGQVSQQSGRHGVNIVDGEELNSISGILTQIAATRDMPGIDGIATYAYAQPRAGSSRIPDKSFFETIGEKVFPGQAEIPDAPWLSRPSEGLIKGVVSRNGQPVDGAIVRLGSRWTHTDGTGFYAFARVQPGNHQLRAEDARGEIGSATVNVAAGQVAEGPIGTK